MMLFLKEASWTGMKALNLGVSTGANPAKTAVSVRHYTLNSLSFIFAI